MLFQVWGFGNCLGSWDRKKGLLQKGSFHISRISRISKFCRISRKWLDSPLFSTVWGCLESLDPLNSLESLEHGLSEKTPFPKDPFFKRPLFQKTPFPERWGQGKKGTKICKKRSDNQCFSCCFAPLSVRISEACFLAISMAFPQLLIAFQSISVNLQSLSVTPSNFQSLSFGGKKE